MSRQKTEDSQIDERSRGKDVSGLIVADRPGRFELLIRSGKLWTSAGRFRTRTQARRRARQYMPLQWVIQDHEEEYRDR